MWDFGTYTKNHKAKTALERKGDADDVHVCAIPSILPRKSTRMPSTGVESLLNLLQSDAVAKR